MQRLLDLLPVVQLESDADVNRNVEVDARCRECKLSNAELVVFPCLEAACISVSFRHKQTITTSCARTTTFPLGRTNSQDAVLHLDTQFSLQRNWTFCNVQYLPRDGGHLGGQLLDHLSQC